MNSYYYIDEATKQQCGPFPINELQTKGIKPTTMVWCTGMGDWAEAQAVTELSFLFDTNSSASQGNDNIQQNPNTGNNQSYNQQGGSQQMYGSNVFGRQNSSNLDVRPMPKNWLIESILVTVLCCLPFGIAGIVNATKVESLYYAGDYEAAEQASKDAKKWTLIGLGSTGVLLVIYFIFIIIAAVAGSL